MANIITEKEWVYWTHTCEVVQGCTPISEGCTHCWAKGMAHRFKRDFSRITVHLDRLERVVKGKPGKVISLWNDLYHEELSMDQHNEIFEIIFKNPWHTFLALTKRPSFIQAGIDGFGKPHLYPYNLWIGTTAENKERADERISELLNCSSPNLFLSLEPLLGPVDLGRYLPLLCCNGRECGCRGEPINPPPYPAWVIVGCETGPKRRPCNPEWIHSIVKQCKAGGVPCFVKAVNIDGKVLKKWDDPAFPDDLKVREFPCCTAFEVDEDAEREEHHG
jgi:protein gp37